LSYLYFIRTLPLEPGRTYAADRHYDARKNPVEVVALHRETLELNGVIYPTIVAELRVTDAEAYGGRGPVPLYLTADVDRVPVRIETTMPVAGRVILELQARTERDVDVAAR